MRPRPSARNDARTPHESAGTGVARAWWASLHPLVWCALGMLVLAVAWWLWG